MSEHIRIRPGILYDRRENNTSPRKSYLREWYFSVVGYIPEGYKNQIWVKIRKTDLSKVIDRLIGKDEKTRT